jgi:hypothetical protein
VLNREKPRLPAPCAAACLVHYLLLQKFTSPRFTILNGCRPVQFIEATKSLDVGSMSPPVEIGLGRTVALHRLRIRFIPDSLT